MAINIAPDTIFYWHALYGKSFCKVTNDIATDEQHVCIVLIGRHRTPISNFLTEYTPNPDVVKTKPIVCKAIDKDKIQIWDGTEATRYIPDIAR